MSNSLFATNLTSSASFLSVNESLLPYRAEKNSSTCFKSGNSNFDAISGIVSTSNCKSTRKKIVQIITKCQVYINYLDDLPDLVRFGNRLSKMAGGCVAYDGGSSSRPLNNAFKKC